MVLSQQDQLVHIGSGAHGKGLFGSDGVDTSHVRLLEGLLTRVPGEMILMLTRWAMTDSGFIVFSLNRQGVGDYVIDPASVQVGIGRHDEPKDGPH